MKKVTRLAIGISAISLLVLTSPIDVRAAVQFPEEGIEGIALSLDNCRDSSEEIDKVLTKILNTKIISPYANLGVSTATSYVNIRKSANTDSEVLGKLYRGCAADILEREDGWVKIKSGDVEGYINTDYLAIGKEAEQMIEEYATKYAIVQTETLRVREEQNAESKILTLIPFDEEYIIVKEHKDWAEILLGVDEDNNGNDFTGFISKDYIEIRVDFDYAISIEEENRRIAAEEAAIKAEQERMQKLAEEKAKKAEDKRRADAAEKKAAEDAKKKNNNSSNNNTNDKPKNESNTSSGNSSVKGQSVADYALKFVGNPYVYGGTSLTKGADCSGFVSTIYRGFGYNIARDSRSQAATSGKQVSYSDALPGDLIFYTNSSGNVNHVAMYIGNGKVVHASNPRQGIKVSQARYRDIYKVKRIIN